MKLLVLPPHRDVTLAPETPEGWHVMDVARDFCRRVVSDAAMADAIQARVTAPATPRSMRELLLLRAGQVLSLREQRYGHTRLRALGAVLTALSGPPSGVRLRLDDLELEEGTTERSADVLRTVGQPAPYAEDLARAAERFPQAERVRLWLERDQQLPAAAWLARACPPQVPLEVAGPFAVAHRKVLARMPMFQRAEFVDAAAPLRWRVAPLDGEPGPGSLVWIPEALDLLVCTFAPPLNASDALLFDAPAPRDLGTLTTKQVLGACTPGELKGFTGGAPWGGHVLVASLPHAEALIESGCRVAVVGFCAVREGFMVDPLGTRMNVQDLARCARRLRDAGVRLVAEWWVGAPGVDEAALEETLAALDAEPLFDHVAGARPFHWPLEHRGLDRPFQRLSVEPQRPPPDRDLARSQPFEAPNTIPTARLPEVLAALSTRLMQRAPLNPGRVAAACLRGPTAPSPVREDASERAPIRLDDDCALVQLPASLDGAPKPTWYAANLRTGTVLAMDARLAPKLAGLDHPVPAADALGAVPEAQRRKLVDTLVGKTVLTRVYE
ncbi:hypothetical protein [Pyxidicoccus sp. MSG2]|uniref:hypothetical protein n=1 Tax=Pyxidicoccus sp. MSG2 TaxID=2996790 RepID=UPI00226F6B9D|nr:hypothetical protein [Pyxidicoccus sp. MSG2]MCY1022065.1 hypothetical protein [Pyxidicoccus sp. MSG2]